MRDIRHKVSSNGIDPAVFGDGVDNGKAAGRARFVGRKPGPGPLGRLGFGEPPIDDVTRPFAEILRVITDAFVEPAHEGELQRLLGIEFASTRILDDVLDVAIVKVVEEIVEFVDGRRQTGIAGGKGLCGATQKDLRLARHAGDKITYVMIGMGSLEPADRLGDVGHQVSRALDIAVHVDRGHDEAKVRGDRLLSDERVDTPLLHLQREQVDFVVSGDE